MSVFDSNLLEDAIEIIGTQIVTYRPYYSRVKNAKGAYVATYAEAQTLEGSFQPVPRRLYEAYGLDFQKNYATLFISQNLIDIERDVAGDLFAYGGKTYQAESRTPWFTQDGWDSVLLVEIPAAAMIDIVTPPEDGEYETDDLLEFTLAYNQAVQISGTPRLTLTVGENTRYASYISGTTNLLFRYTIVEADVADGIAVVGQVDLNGGTIGLPAAAAILTFIPPDLSGVVVNAG